MQRIVQAFWVATLATDHGMKEVASLPSKQLRYTTSTGLQLQLAHGYHSASRTACSSKCRSPGTMTSLSWLSPCPRQQRSNMGGTLGHCTGRLMDAVLYPARHCVWLNWPSRGSLH
ncbi:unnamed protein product, partial [Ixodes persulcatus]